MVIKLWLSKGDKIGDYLCSDDQYSQARSHIVYFKSSVWTASEWRHRQSIAMVCPWCGCLALYYEHETLVFSVMESFKNSCCLLSYIAGYRLALSGIADDKGSTQCLGCSSNQRALFKELGIQFAQRLNR